MARRALFLALLLLPGLAMTVQALGITYLSDQRYVEANVGFCNDLTGVCGSDSASATPDPPFSSFAESLPVAVYDPDGAPGWPAATASADQTSVLGLYSMTGDGGATVHSEGAVSWGDASSVFLTRFSLDEALPFSFSGSLHDDSGVSHYILRTGDGTILYSGTGSWWEPIVFDHSGTLAPGVYELELLASTDYAMSSAEWEFQFVVPEPATGTLVLLGLLGLRRWRPR